jgi:magnesium-transporting ATPase (P-type)
MSRKMIGIALIILGILMIALALSATTLGIGTNPGFGWKKILLSGVGLAVTLVGIGLSILKKENSVK